MMHNIQFTEFKVSSFFATTTLKTLHGTPSCSVHVESRRGLMLGLIREAHPLMSIWRRHLIAPVSVY